MPLDGAFPYAVPDWWQRLQAGQPPLPDLPLDEERAERAVRLFNSLRLPDVAGKPRLAEAGGEWFRQLVRLLFGAIGPEPGVPGVGEALLLVPKKNNKTTGAAALALLKLMLTDQPNAQMLVLGPTQNIAQRCFDQAVGMINADRRLVPLFEIQHHTKTITRGQTGATLRVKTFDMAVVTGEIPAFVIVDELHILGHMNGAERVIGQLTGGMITNPTAQLIYITTQSDVPPAGVFETTLRYARAVRDGEIVGSRFLPLLYEFPESVQTEEGKPFMRPDMWRLVNPNWGLSVKPAQLTELYDKAAAKGPDQVQQWLSQHLNIQIGMGTGDGRWTGADWWIGATEPGLTLDEIIARSEVCTIGVDGGGLDDLLGLAVLGRCRDTGRWLHWGRAWGDAESIRKRRKGIVAQLDDFAADGDFVWTEGEGDGLAEIVEVAERLNLAGLLPEKGAAGLDPAGIADLVDALAAAGLTTDQVVPVSQGWRLNSAVQGVPRKLKGGTLVHCGQRLMAWAVGNVKTERKGNAVTVTKAQSGSAKIDPLMALFNAAVLMSYHPVAGRSTVAIPADYEVA